MNSKEKSEPGPSSLFAQRMRTIPKSFIREMLKTAASKNIISFAGGLPDENLIPAQQLKEAFIRANSNYGNKLYQYSNSEGFLPLRQWIASRYKEKFDIKVSAEEILLTNGSQQAFDLVGKVFIEKNDKVIIEQPGYLGVIQSLLGFEPQLVDVPLDQDGMNMNMLKKKTRQFKAKLMHIIPNFQNPSGISYSEAKRVELAKLITERGMILIEDDPYGELYFDKEYKRSPVKKLLGDHGVLLGSFSKTLSPGMRLGWMVASPEIIDKLIIAKQASDLHTNNLSQMMAYEYLAVNDYESHLNKIRTCYKSRKDMMVSAIKKYFPEGITINIPDGGMFLWVSLPRHLSSQKLVRLCMEMGVVFVPGNVFYTDGMGENTFRLNFSKSTDEEIDKGIRIISDAIAYLKSKNNCMNISSWQSCKYRDSQF